MVKSQRYLDEEFMNAAIEQARVGVREGGIPIGSVVVLDEEVIGRGRNRRIQLGSAIRHAELDALEDAGWLPPSEYERLTLHTTLSPCYMCTGAVLHYRIPRVVVGEARTVPGAVDLLLANDVEVMNLDLDECYTLMAEFIAKNPARWPG